MSRPRRDVPWLTWRDNGVAYANWYDETVRRTFRQSLDTKSAAEAAKAFGKFLIEGPAKSYGDAGITVSQALDRYDREHVEREVVDKERQRAAIAHLKAYFGETPLKSIGPTESEAYADARRTGLVGGGKRRRNKVGTDATIRRELNCLVAAANHAVFWKHMPKGDLPTVKLPSEERGVEVKWLTKAQLRQAIADASGALRDFILLAYYTAARKRSIERLTRFQVNLELGRINLMPTGAKATKKVKPIVPLYPEIRPVVERLLATSETEYLFGQPTSFYRPFVKLLAARGIGAHPHMLRHSRASHMLQDGETIFKVARLLGDTVATVEKVYAHAMPEFLATESKIGGLAEMLE